MVLVGQPRVTERRLAKGKNGSGRAGRKRRGSGEEFTGAKEGETETRTPQLEMNLPNPDRQLHYFDAIKNELANIARAQKRKKDLEKAAAKENVDVGAISFVLQMEKGDAVKYRMRLEQQAVLMRARGLPFQMTIHDIAFANSVEQAKAEAKAAARGGRSPECRYPEGTPAYDAYLETYTREQARMVPGAENLTDEEIDAAIADGRSGQTEQAAAAH